MKKNTKSIFLHNWKKYNTGEYTCKTETAKIAISKK